MTQPKQESLEKEFDNTFLISEGIRAKEIDVSIRADVVKKLISRLLAEQATAFVAGLPKIKPAGGDLMMNDEYERCNGHNQCRQQTLDNWKKAELI
jgi:hypothetical protein